MLIFIMIIYLLGFKKCLYLCLVFFKTIIAYER